jgi:hypothetical protein
MFFWLIFIALSFLFGLCFKKLTRTFIRILNREKEKLEESNQGDNTNDDGLNEDEEIDFEDEDLKMVLNN